MIERMRSSTIDIIYTYQLILELQKVNFCVVKLLGLAGCIVTENVEKKKKNM